MLRPRALLSLSLALAASSLAAVGCRLGDEDPARLDAGAHGDATTAPADAGPPLDAGGAPDAEPLDAGPPPRRAMVERKLFGAMPLDNAVVDPLFDLASQNWYAISDPSGSSPSFAPTTKHHYGAIPSGMPAVEQKKGNVASSDVVLLGNVAAFDVPAEASVWIGRRAADGERGVRAAVAITTSVGQVQAFELQPDGAPSVLADDVVWTRYTGELDVRSVGISTFVVSDDTEVPYLVSGPTVRTRQDKARPPRPAVRRPPLPREARALRLIDQRRYGRMVPAPRARREPRGMAPTPRFP